MSALLAAPAIAQDSSTEPRTEKAPKASAVFEHPSVTVGGLKMDARGLLQTNATDSDASNSTNDGQVNLAHRRIGVDGSFRKVLSFQIEGELDTPGPWRDVYADYRQLDVFRVKAGQFKLPFSLDRNTGAANLDFAFRSESASEIAPGRRIGVMAHGRFWKRTLEYEAGFFPGARPDPTAPYGGPALERRMGAGRLSVRPFNRVKSSLGNLHLAAAFTAGLQSEGISDMRGRTALGTKFFQRAYWVKGLRRRTGFEAQWQPGPASVTWEYARISDQRLDQGIGGQDLSPLNGAGAYLSGTWAITGGSKARGVDKPRRPLFQGGVGAVEVAARVESLRYGSRLDDPQAASNPRALAPLGGSDHLVTAGVNWYVNRWIKAQFDAIHETARSPSIAPAGRSSFWGRAFAIQLTI